MKMRTEWYSIEWQTRINTLHVNILEISWIPWTIRILIRAEKFMETYFRAWFNDKRIIENFDMKNRSQIVRGQSEMFFFSLNNQWSP